MRSRPLFLALALLAGLISSASLALAHDELYFEYAPDPFNSQRLPVAGLQYLAQIFSPLHDISFTGADLWLDNVGSSGSATFTLRDSDDVFLATKTISIPPLAAVPGGQKLHIDFDQQINLSSGKIYKLEISSSLAGLALYHSKQLNFLEHNRGFISPYVGGVAKIEDEEQNFSFKYALYRYPVITTSESDSGQVQQEQPGEETQEPESSPLISITNARVSAVGDKWATLSWTTNIAADSRVSIRSQLSPLTVYTSAFDPTLELEHSLTVSGLVPSSGYFADVFSGQGNELLLTTYTISFETLELSEQSLTEQEQAQAQQAEEESSNSQAQQADQPPEQSQQTSQQEPDPSSSPDSSTSSPISPQENQASNEEPGSDSESSQESGSIFLTSGQKGDNFSIGWSSSEKPSTGYRIDVFNKYNQLERQFYVSADANQKDIAQLPSGEYRAIVYANNDGVFTKIAAPFHFSVKSTKTRNIWFSLITLSALFFSVAGFVVFRFMREKSALPEIEE